MFTQAVTQRQGYIVLEKSQVFHKLVKGEEVIKSCARAFTCPNKNDNDISELGKDMMVDLFGGKSKDTVFFTRKVLSAKSCHTREASPNFICYKLPQPTTTKSWCGLIW